MFRRDDPVHMEFSVLHSPSKKNEKPIWDPKTTVQPTYFHVVVGHTGILSTKWAVECCRWPLQVSSGSWARFENEATYWNAGQRAYCPGPPRGTFLQISASCTFHDNVLSVSVIVVSVANLFVQRISTEQLHNPHAQKFLLSVTNHICICCLCHCSGAHYYRIALYPMHHISMYP